MSNKQIYLIIGLVVSTIVLSIGITNIDSTASSVSTIALENPEILDSAGKTLFLDEGALFHYHLGVVFIYVGYVGPILIFLWYLQKNKEKTISTEKTRKV